MPNFGGGGGWNPANKELLEAYDQANADLSDAVSMKHGNGLDHANSLDHDVREGIVVRCKNTGAYTFDEYLIIK